MINTLRKIPLWAYMVVLVAVSCCAMIYSVSVVASMALSQFVVLTKAVMIVAIVFGGILRAFLARIAVRIVFNLGNSLFFRTTRTVPDYNLRRLPMPYNDFLRFGLAAMILSSLWSVLMMVLNFATPYLSYLWNWLEKLGTLACLLVCYLLMDRTFVPAWQSGRCFVALAIPTGVLFVLWVLFSI